MNSPFDECGAIRLSGSTPCVKRPGHENHPGDESHQPGDGSDPWRERPLRAPADPDRVEASVRADAVRITLPYTARATTGHPLVVEPAAPVRLRDRVVSAVSIGGRVFTAAGALDLSIAIRAAWRKKCSRTVSPVGEGRPIQVRPVNRSTAFVDGLPFALGDALLLAAAIAAAVHRPLKAVATARGRESDTPRLDKGYRPGITSVKSVVAAAGGST
ncbi:hypothetical protein I0C86_41650 [Plantactinospora sp. S1510]|uniref:Uncharacterized protein n=1 Tax=Plantactinospora alkalitolerans TaxID=2789879 RepID=A0ABS0HAI3_9ACTN|nr:hypothetical protein [Plantactinospora alkalitolerans]MBF9135359.1 hypothetical protein [Plantactinospora alkalitolerans]